MQFCSFVIDSLNFVPHSCFCNAQSRLNAPHSPGSTPNDSTPIDSTQICRPCSKSRALRCPATRVSMCLGSWFSPTVERQGRYSASVAHPSHCLLATNSPTLGYDCCRYRPVTLGLLHHQAAGTARALFGYTFSPQYHQLLLAIGYPLPACHYAASFFPTARTATPPRFALVVGMSTDSLTTRSMIDAHRLDSPSAHSSA